jgi:hypothetical protein
MKTRHPARVPAVRPSLPSPEAIDEACFTVHHACDMLVGDGDLYYHDRIKRILTEAGFTVWRLEREECHPVWVGWIRPGTGEIARDNRKASNQLRKIMTKAGLRIKPDELTVFDQRKNMIRFTFMFAYGCAGVLT